MEKTQTPGVYRRGSRYVAIYRDNAGKQRSKSARTLKEAKAIRTAHSADVLRGEYRAPSRVRFEEYALAWVDGHRGIRDTTRQDYKRSLEQRAIPFFGRVALTDIDRSSLKAYVRHLEGIRLKDGSPLSDASIENAVKPVRACLEEALDEELIRSNPARGLRLRRRDRPAGEDAAPAKALTREQLAAFLEAVDPQFRLFFRTLAETGLRGSEIIGLQWRHVELDGTTPHVKVRRAIVRPSANRRGDAAVNDPKTKHSRRDVPISFSLVDELRARRAATRFAGLDDPVFASRTGTPLMARNVRRRHLDPTMQSIGVEDAGFHTFRHTAASMMFKRGRDPVQVQHFLGHSSAAFTMKVYVHLLGGEGAPPLDLSLELGQVAAEVAVKPTEVSGD
jgi:integrase